MDKKILAILAIIVVVVAAAAAAFVVLGDDDDDKDSDYTILDSNENIKEGLVVKLTSKTSEGSMIETYTVTSVAEGVAVVEVREKMNGLIQTDELSDYTPSEFDFDYTDDNEIPDGVSVTKDGNVYKISGKNVGSYDDGLGSKWESEMNYDLKITFDGVNCTDVSGTEKGFYKYYEDEKLDSEEKADIKYSVNGSVVECRGSGEFYYITDYDVDDFYSDILMHYDETNYDSATLISDDKSIGGITASSYSLKKGDNTDLTAIVYKDFILKLDGKMDGKDGSYIAEIYME